MTTILQRLSASIVAKEERTTVSSMMILPLYCYNNNDYYNDNDNDNDRVARLETELCGANDVITQLRHELQVRV